MADGKPDFLNGVPQLLVLQLLSQEPMHGYQLVAAIRVRTGANLEFGEGCIYPLLHRLKRNGLVSSRRDLVAGRSRVVYRLTHAGQKKLQSTTSRWNLVVETVQSLLVAQQGGRQSAT